MFNSRKLRKYIKPSTAKTPIFMCSDESTSLKYNFTDMLYSSGIDLWNFQWPFFHINALHWLASGETKPNVYIIGSSSDVTCIFIVTTNHLWQLQTIYIEHITTIYGMMYYFRNLREMLVILMTTFSWNQSISQCLTRDCYNLWIRPTSMASLIPIRNTSLHSDPSIFHYFNTIFILILSYFNTCIL